MSVDGDSRVGGWIEDIPNSRNHEQHESGGREHPSDIASLELSNQSIGATRQFDNSRTS